jgi:hypothetical protein
MKRGKKDEKYSDRCDRLCILKTLSFFFKKKKKKKSRKKKKRKEKKERNKEEGKSNCITYVEPEKTKQTKVRYP